MSKLLLVFNYHSTVDLITNSSSELFVFKEPSLNRVLNVINAIHPNWEHEYYEPKLLKHCEWGEIACYLQYAYCCDPTGMNYSYFTELFIKLGVDKPLLRIEKKWSLDNYYVLNTEYFCEINKDAVVAALDPKNQMFLMFSSIDNPDYEFQEKFENIAERFHLG